MIYTCRDLIIQAYRVSGIYSDGNVPGDDVDLALMEFNGLIGSWRQQPFWPKADVIYEFGTTSGKTEYTIGVPNGVDPDPDWVVAQEIIDINSAQVLLGNVWSPIREIGPDTYFKQSRVIMGTVPTGFCYRRTWDPYNKFLLLNPSGGAWTLRLSTIGAMAEYQLDDEINLPSGYFGTMQYGLATQLCRINNVDPTFMQKTYDERVSVLKAMNRELPPLLKANMGTAIYNIGSDSVLYSR